MSDTVNNNTQGYKTLLTSKTIWGLVFLAVGSITGRAVEVDDATLQQVCDIAALLFEIGGGLFAVYGRIVANKEIKLLP